MLKCDRSDEMSANEEVRNSDIKKVPNAPGDGHFGRCELMCVLHFLLQNKGYFIWPCNGSDWRAGFYHVGGFV